MSYNPKTVNLLPLEACVPDVMCIYSICSEHEFFRSACFERGKTATYYTIAVLSLDVVVITRLFINLLTF